MCCSAFYRQRRLIVAKHCRRGSTLWLVIVVLVIMFVALAAFFVYFNMSGQDGEEPLMSKVSNVSFDHLVREQGEVESSNNVEYKCWVKSRNSGGTDILWVIAEGKFVKPGDEMVKIDSSALEQERDQQEIICNTSLALKIQAENTFAAAEIAKVEYLEGTFKQEVQTIIGEIFVAEENLRRTALSVRSSERLAAKGLVTSLQLEADRFAVEKAGNELKLAQGKLATLRDYTKKKMLKTFDSDIETARARKEAENQSHVLELKKLVDVNEQIGKCIIKSEHTGQVVHANKFSSRGGSEFVVEEGAKVREGQTLIRIPDPSKMQVKAKINESRITLIKEGMPVSIVIDALSDEPLEGRVTYVNEYAEPTSFFSSNIKEYVTVIEIVNPPKNIRPGLTAEVGIHVEHFDRVLQIPVQAVYEYKGHTFSLVKKGDRWDTREIEIGSSNDITVTIKSGLEKDEMVVLNPRRHLKKMNLPEILEEEPSNEIASKRQRNFAEPRSGAQQTKTEGGQRRTGQQRGRGGPGGRNSAGGGSADLAAIATRMLQGLDSDKDGKISSDELKAISADRRQSMSGADTNGDGFIDRAELTAMISKRRQSGGGGGGRPTGAGE